MNPYRVYTNLPSRPRKLLTFCVILGWAVLSFFLGMRFEHRNAITVPPACYDELRYVTEHPDPATNRCSFSDARLEDAPAVHNQDGHLIAMFRCRCAR